MRPWSGHFLWQPGLLSYVGPGGSSDRHSHHALQLAISFDEPLELLLDDRRVWARAVLVESGVPHAFRTDGRRIFYALIEPHSAIGFSLTHRTAQVTGRDLADILPIGDAPAAEANALTDYTRRMFDLLAPRPSAPHLSEPVTTASAIAGGQDPCRRLELALLWKVRRRPSVPFDCCPPGPRYAEA